MRFAVTPHSCKRSCACSRPPAAVRRSSRRGHAVRMDALHLIRAAAEFADTLERDAQNASAAQLGKTEEEVRRRQNELQEREAEVERYRQESERQRPEMMNAARNESRELLARSHADATPRAPGGRSQGQPPARAVPPSGDRAHERRARRGRADARVGACAGGRHPCARPARCRAASGRGGPRSGRDLDGRDRDRPGGRAERRAGASADAGLRSRRDPGGDPCAGRARDG